LLARRRCRPENPSNHWGTNRFECTRLLDGRYKVRDHTRDFNTEVPTSLLLNERFQLAKWYKKRLQRVHDELHDRLNGSEHEHNILRALDSYALSPLECQLEEIAQNLYTPLPDVRFLCGESGLQAIELNGQQISAGTYPALQRGSATTKDFKQLMPKPVVVVVHINGRALINSGSLSVLMSVTLAEQLKVPRHGLTKPIVVQLAVQGSRSKVNFGTRVCMEYQTIKED
jgi:hypothetical protein